MLNGAYKTKGEEYRVNWMRRYKAGFLTDWRNTHHFASKTGTYWLVDQGLSNLLQLDHFLGLVSRHEGDRL